MHRHTRLNLGLLSLLLLLAAVVFYTLQTRPEDRARLPALTDLAPQSITRIDIERGGEHLILTKGHDPASSSWQLIRPLRIEANALRIESVLALLRAPVHSRYDAREVDLHAFGLDTPGLRVHFDQHRIAFGIVNPVTGLRYLLYAGRVHTIEDTYSPLLNAGSVALTSLHLLPTDARITRLALLNQTIDRDAGGRWRSSLPLSADHIAGILEQWRHAQAFGVHRYLQRQSLGTVRIGLHNAATIEYRITDTEPWLILARPELDIEYHLDAEWFETLLKPQQSSSFPPPETGPAGPHRP